MKARVPLLSALVTVTLFELLVSEQEVDRFPVFWNVFSKPCIRLNKTIPLDQYGITHNKDQEFLGDEIVIFYEDTFGMYPYFRDDNKSQPINGGLPQNADIAGHLRIAAEQIIAFMPREDFSGLAIIDFEHWRPMFQLNWGKKQVYKEESVRLVKEKFPTLSDKAQKAQAEREFNMAARKFMTRTIMLARKLRPYAKWGFYGFPYCNYQFKDGARRCNDKFIGINDNLTWLTSLGNALYPSTYLYNMTTTNFGYIQGVVMEAKRIAALSNPSQPIYAYNKFEYQPYGGQESFYTKRDLCSSLKQTYALGANGLILWTTSSNMKYRCDGIIDYFAKQFGPTLLTVKKRAQKCSVKLCSGHGRCTLRTPEFARCRFAMPLEDYVCECDAGYAGFDCSKRAYAGLAWEQDVDAADNDDLLRNDEVVSLTAGLSIVPEPLTTPPMEEITAQVTRRPEVIEVVTLPSNDTLWSRSVGWFQALYPGF